MSDLQDVNVHQSLFPRNQGCSRSEARRWQWHSQVPVSSLEDAEFLRVLILFKDTLRHSSLLLKDTESLRVLILFFAGAQRRQRHSQALFPPLEKTEFLRVSKLLFAEAQHRQRHSQAIFPCLSQDYLTPYFNTLQCPAKLCRRMKTAYSVRCL